MTATTLKYQAARLARIILQRDASEIESKQWQNELDKTELSVSNLIKKLIALPELKALDQKERASRMWNAAFQRYSSVESQSLDHWLGQIRYGLISESDLAQEFVKIANTGYRYEPCASPVDTSSDLFLVKAKNKSELVFSQGENKRLYLFISNGKNWEQIDLSAALVGYEKGHIQSVAVNQADDGKISIAIAVSKRFSDGSSALFLATGLDNGLNAADWIAAIRNMHKCTGIPSGAVISKVSFSRNQNNSADMIVLGATVAGAANTYYGSVEKNGDDWNLLRIPEDAKTVQQYALGTYHKDGMWVLYKVGSDHSLVFSVFPDKFGKSINISYTELPKNCVNFLVAPNSNSSVADVFAAGDEIVVYRASNETPEVVVSKTKNAKLLWHGYTKKTEYLLYRDGNTLSYIGKTKGSQWGDPKNLSNSLANFSVNTLDSSDELSLAIVTPGLGLNIEHLTLEGLSPIHSISVEAVWNEIPLTKTELNQAIKTASPKIYFDPDAEFLTSSVDFYLKKIGLWNHQENKWQVENGRLYDSKTKDLSIDALRAYARSERTNPTHKFDYYMQVDEGDFSTLVPGDLNDTKSYINAKFIPEENATDLIFWLFYPYNGAGVLMVDAPGVDKNFDLSPLGTHEGDWEHCLIRIDNDSLQPTRFYLSAHDGGAWHALKDMPKDMESGHTELYVSRHGHALYNEVGDNLFHESGGGSAIYHIGLVNHCEKGSSINLWEDGKTELIAADFLPQGELTEPLWLRFPWRWGRYKVFSQDEISGMVSHILSFLGDNPVSKPIKKAISDLIADKILESGKLGSESYSAGPGAPKYKSNWYGSE